MNRVSARRFVVGLLWCVCAEAPWAVHGQTPQDYADLVARYAKGEFDAVQELTAP